MQELSRRQLLKVGAGVGAAAMLAACAPVATETGGMGSDAMDEPIDLVVWYQDWDGANRIMGWVKPEFETNNENVAVDLQAIGYGDLLNKMLPSIASGTEGDVMMMYTDWVVATDITRVFLDITDHAGGAAALEEKMWPAAFQAVDVPGNKVYYLPWLAGIRGAAMTVNLDHLEEQGIDHDAFETYEEVIEAGVALTRPASPATSARWRNTTPSAPSWRHRDFRMSERGGAVRSACCFPTSSRQ